MAKTSCLAAKDGNTLPTELKTVIFNPDEMQALGSAIGELACPGDIILLTGPLGAGKTCLVQGLARGLNIPGLTPSPTFMLARECRQGRLPLYHLDLYRLEFQEIADLGLDEYLYGQGVAAVEWAEKGAGLVGGDYLLINIFYAGEGARHVYLEPHGARYITLVQELSHKFKQDGTI